MGALYLARDPFLDRLVAIKLLKEELQDDSGLRERFLREAQSVARLRHSNIVIVHDVGEDAGRPFMAMEYIAGETLAQVLRRQPLPPLIRRLSMIEDLCAGLSHAHGAGIIHRDIKPANIMLDADGGLKILDFGIARLGNSGMTQEGMMMGSVNYMSPEQVTGRGVDHRTDIFAAGAVLYEVISLAQAFPGGIDTGVLHRILTEGPAPLEQLVPDIDADLLGIVRRAMERDPTQRYQDANDLRRDLLRVRRRLTDNGAGHSPDLHRAAVAEHGPTPASGTGRADGDRPRRLNPERFAELQRQQVAEHLRFGEEAFARGEHDAALQHAERAATVDPNSQTAFDLIDRARFAIEAKAVRRLLADAVRLLAEGQLDDAAALADEASVEFPDVKGAAELRAEVRAALDRITAAREREQRVAASLERARASIERGGYETALRAVYEVLSIDPERAAARALEQEAQAGLQARREHEQARRHAYDRLAQARALAGDGRYDDAAALITAVTPPSDTVRLAAAEALAFVRGAQREATLTEVLAWAKAAFDRAEFADVLVAIDAIPSDEQSREMGVLRERAENALREQRELERRRAALNAVLSEVESLLARGDLAEARERLDAARTVGLPDDRLSILDDRLKALAAAAEARRQQDVRDRRAANRVEAARHLLESGDGYAAVRLLERDGSGHPLVEETLQEIRTAIAEQEERVRQEAERRRQEEDARRRVALEEARKREEQRKADEQRQRLEEARRRREAEQQRQREEAATLIIDIERAFASGRTEEATRLIQRADAQVAAVDDTDLRRRLDAAKVAAERLERQRQDERRRQEEEARERRRADEERARLEAQRLAEIEAARVREEQRQAAERERRAREEARRREEEAARQAEEARRREEALTRMLADAGVEQSHEAALTILLQAQTMAPGDTRVRTLVQEREQALARQRADEERARLEAKRLAEIEAARIQEERQAAERERRAREEARRREEEAARRAEEATRAAEEARQQRERAVTRMLAEAGEAESHAAALTILSQARSIAPDDTRVATVILERMNALEAQRAAAAAAEAARIEREQEARRERDATAATAVSRAEALFAAGQHEDAAAVLREAPAHPLTRTALDRFEARLAEIARQRARDERLRQQAERRAARAALVSRTVRDRRVQIGGAVLVAAVVVWSGWQFWPSSEIDQPVASPPQVDTGTKPPAPEPPPDPGPGPAGPTEPTDRRAELQEAFQRARGLYAAGSRSEALQALRPVLAADANYRDGRTLLRSMIADARSELTRAKNEATGAGAGSEQLPPYQRGLANETAGQRAIDANRETDALPLLWNARDDFAAAAQQARMSADARQKEEERLRLERERQLREAAALAEKLKAAEDARKLEETRQRENARAEEARRAEERAAEERAKKEKDDATRDELARRQADEAAIRQILTRYVAAYTRLDEDELRQIDPNFPGIQRKTLIRKLELTLSGVVIDPDPNGQRADVRFTQNFRYEWNNRPFPPTNSGEVRWRLRRVATGWVVE